MAPHWSTIWLVCFGLMTVIIEARSTRQHVQGRKFDCHCQDTPCHSPMDCRGNCDPGWYGSYCQKQNVALNRTATQKGIYQTYHADKAVDGNTNTDFKSGTCSHAAAGEQNRNSWWNVALSTDHQIKYITIYNRKDNANKYRRKGMEVLVDGRSCFKWPKAGLPPTVWNVTCDKTLTGRNVTITILADSLSLCEVQVFVCSDFWFGEDCEKQCNCFDESEICDKVVGQCRSGCPPGFNGTDCLQECVSGTYGFNCSHACGHCLNNTFCVRTNGTCHQGCDDGWTEPACDKACDGKYGKNCASDCGHCNGTNCNHVDGSCPVGCQPGWNGTTCKMRLQG
ncbi:multiple epidermal growth factor-like domains protein 10 [Haliotis rubra]|uniref:multiple epidermal growth factor-like domains protein 10 n=1 Tax=Haliotis rubra TaxID=36100 RepID=UPI001EE59437|nr:multiple epidermal growth factor-like domains protein 10 [Haliotis rubra]